MTSTMMTPRVRSLLRQAERVARSGKRAAAETLYRQIVDEEPNVAEGWLALAELTADPEEQAQIYHKVLELEASNERAQAGLRGEALPTLFPPIGEETDADENGNGETDETPPPAKSVAVPTETAVAPEAGQQVACYRHPNKQTALRCYSCQNPICINCAQKTPVGYLCPSCKRNIESSVYNSKSADYLIALLVALPLSLIIGFLVVAFSVSAGFFFILFMFFIAGAVGGFIGRVVKRAIGRRRGRYIPHLVAGCVAFGVLLPMLPLLLSFSLFSLIGPGIYLFVATSSAFFWVK